MSSATPGLIAFTAPRLAPLRDHMVERLRRAPLPPRSDELIVVQSQGMREWLRLQLADAFGCAASVELSFPASFVQQLSRMLGVPLDGRDAFSREVVAWRIDSLLRAVGPAQPEYAALGPYLREGDESMRFSLASQVAARFDDYQLFRPELLNAWERGEPGLESPHAAWQAALWRSLCADGGTHTASQVDELLERLREGTAETLKLPARVTVFGISTLPPRFIEVLAALAKHVDVHVYAAVLPETTAHPIEASLGAQGRVLHQLLRENGAEVRIIAEPHARAHSLLTALQRELASGADGAAPLDLDAGDSSLRIHAAHGMVRELEVIRDQLYDAFASDHTLRPHDVILLVPDAREWAPMVDAVFGGDGNGLPHIPYRVADRPQRGGSPAADAFLGLLALAEGRMAHSELFELLQHPMIRSAAGLEEAEIATLGRTTSAANVRWGYDSASLVALGLPASPDAPTWRAGLDRLLLGQAAGRVDDLMLGTLPQAGDTAGDPEALAKLCLWADGVGATLADWRRARSLAEWSDAFQATVARFIGQTSRSERAAVRSLEQSIRKLESVARWSGHTGPVTFGVVHDWLAAELTDEMAGKGFVSGSMTVAELKPMRSIPFKVIAIAGLGDAAFPRRDRRAAFDMLGVAPRAGDRNLREDDRQLFLDLFMAAEDRLILTYTARAARDNSPCAPSVVLDELLDHLDGRSGGTARRTLVVEHPLQPFSERYFGEQPDPRLFTFADTAARAAAARAAATRAGGGSREGDGERDGVGDGGDEREGSAGVAFVVRPLPEPNDSPVAEMPLRELSALWENPSRWFCRQVLRLSVPEDDDSPADSERFALGDLEKGAVRARMLGAALGAGRDAGSGAGSEAPREARREAEVAVERRRLIADGELPPGELGAAWHARIAVEVEFVLAECPKEAQTAATLLVHGAGWRVTGSVDRIVNGARYVIRAGPLRARHRIRAWVEHVAMCAASQQGTRALPTRTVLIGRKRVNEVDKIVREEIAEVPSAVALLERWMGIAAEARRAPLAFFPMAGAAYAEARCENAEIAAMLAKGRKSRKKTRDPAAVARKEFRSTLHFSGDDADPYLMLCFRGAEPLEANFEGFMRLTAVLFEPWWTLPQATP